MQVSNYLPPTMIRLVLNEQGKDYATALSHEAINKLCSPIKSSLRKKIVRSQEKSIRQVVKAGRIKAQQQIPTILHQAHQSASEKLNVEINRLQALKLVNPNIRQEEIDYFKNQLKELDACIDMADIRLDALRVIVTT